MNNSYELVIKVVNNKIQNNNDEINKLIKILKKDKQKIIENLSLSIKLIKYNQIIEKKKLDDIICKQQNIINQCTNLVRNNNKKLKEKYECGICFDKHVNVALCPCGHLFCSECISNQPYCYYCRKPIESKLNIFFS